MPPTNRSPILDANIGAAVLRQAMHKLAAAASDIEASTRSPNAVDQHRLVGIARGNLDLALDLIREAIERLPGDEQDGSAA